MSIGISVFSLENPAFVTYLIGASLMLLKMMLQPWMTVYRMMKVNAGFRNPEDAKKTPLNPNPAAGQTEVNEYVDRSRRMNLNDLETIPGFLIAGFLFVLTQPPLWLVHVLVWMFVLARAGHFFAYVTAQIHDVRATFWTFSSLPVLVMAGYTLVKAVSA